MTTNTSTQTVMSAYNFAIKNHQQHASSINYGNDEIIYTDDTDFLNFFNFTPDLEYLNNLCEYINDEYCLELEIDQTILSLVCNDCFPLIVDFSTKSLFVFDDIWQKHQKNNEVSMEELALYRFMKFEHKSIYAPMLTATNSTYLKPIALMIFSKYKDVEGVWYILYRFFDWASFTVGINSVKKTMNTKGINKSLEINPSTKVLSLPFSCTFIKLFYKIQPVANLCSISHDERQYESLFTLKSSNLMPCYLQSSNMLINLTFD